MKGSLTIRSHTRFMGGFIHLGEHFFPLVSYCMPCCHRRLLFIWTVKTISFKQRVSIWCCSTFLADQKKYGEAKEQERCASCLREREGERGGQGVRERLRKQTRHGARGNQLGQWWALKSGCYSILHSLCWSITVPWRLMEYFLSPVDKGLKGG